ncbi:protein rhiA [Reichenbachiella versicolor]|uniref:protein rhiA n=1 Tax=Reichenbachiella versicolor TaxID=1821036 RepID=UPI000D6DC668|nr:protein rhiA [Reichenbachiella versicolor]
MEYTLNFKNNSSQRGNACVFQTDPNLGVHDVLSLAWFAKSALPTTMVKFNWDVNYNFTWSRQGVLIPGVKYEAAQIWDADLSNNNAVDFLKDTSLDAYTFDNQTAGPEDGSLYVYQKRTVTPNQTSVGIGMSGSGTFVVSSQPNMQLQFTPHPKYWIVFGSFEQGEVLDIEKVTSTAQEIAFPVNQYTMNVVLNSDNTWSVH